MIFKASLLPRDSIILLPQRRKERQINMSRKQACWTTPPFISLLLRKERHWFRMWYLFVGKIFEGIHCAFKFSYKCTWQGNKIQVHWSLLHSVLLSCCQVVWCIESQYDFDAWGIHLSFVGSKINHPVLGKFMPNIKGCFSRGR